MFILKSLGPQKITGEIGIKEGVIYDVRRRMGSTLPKILEDAQTELGNNDYY